MDFLGRYNLSNLGTSFANSLGEVTKPIAIRILQAGVITTTYAFRNPKSKILMSQIFLAGMLLSYSHRNWASKLTSNGVSEAYSEKGQSVPSKALSTHQFIPKWIHRKIRRATYTFASWAQRTASYGIHRSLLYSCFIFTAHVGFQVIFRYDIEIKGSGNIRSNAPNLEINSVKELTVAFLRYVLKKLDGQ